MFKKFKNEKGSQLIELSFIYPTFILIIIGFYDISHFLTVETMLTKGAYDAAMMASRMPNIDTDINNINPSSNEYKRFKIARRLVIEEARRLPIATIVGEAGSSDPARLKNFRMTDMQSSGNPQSGVYDAAVIRPAECALVDNPDGRTVNPASCLATDCNDESCLKHPVIPPKSDGSSYNTNQKDLMEDELMMVVLKSEFNTMSPWLGNMEAQGIGLARRQPLPFSPFERGMEVSEGITIDYQLDPPPAAPNTPGSPEPSPPCSYSRLFVIDCLSDPNGNLQKKYISYDTCECDTIPVTSTL